MDKRDQYLPNGMKRNDFSWMILRETFHVKKENLIYIWKCESSLDWEVGFRSTGARQDF